MTLEWSAWQGFDGSPYLHWSVNGPGEELVVSQGSDGGEDVTLLHQVARASLDAHQSKILGTPAEPSVGTGDTVPIPDFANNPTFAAYIDSHKTWVPDDIGIPGGIADGTPVIPDDTVIVGVIDVGIPLGHNRFRNPDGSSRILAAWQMLAEWGGENGLSQPYLPFGRELYQGDIDRMLAEHSGGDLKGWLDEDSFNRATGVLEMKHVRGHREVAGRYSHGAHVLDAAAGCNPEDIDPDEAEFRRRVKIIAVNIPSSTTFGASGTHLDNFMTTAIQRISELADAIWMKCHDGYTHDAHGNRIAGYPVVINISFGKQAGSKDSLDAFPATLKKFRQTRHQHMLAPVFFATPSGNDNILRCNAFLEPRPGENLTLDWRVLPEDRSSNFVEIWTRNQDDGGSLPLQVTLSPPGHAHADFEPQSGQDAGFQILGNFASIYFQRVTDTDTGTQFKFRYVLCIAPTARASNDRPVAPAGTWTIKVRNISDARIQCALSIQTDQQILPGSAINLRSYFDDPGYQLYDDRGALRESYSYPPQEVNGEMRSRNHDILADTPVRRHGTMNASAAHGYVTRVGGYRASDGRPAFYSSTGRGRADGQDDGTEVQSSRDNGRKGAPTASFPTDDGPAHFGILSAGAANGSVVAMRGTSFASSQAAREIARLLLKESEINETEMQMLLEIARATEWQTPPVHANPFAVDLTETLGEGRIESPLNPRVNRTGRPQSKRRVTGPADRQAR